VIQPHLKRNCPISMVLIRIPVKTASLLLIGAETKTLENTLKLEKDMESNLLLMLKPIITKINAKLTMMVN
jgi:hypothetical protein